jgi:hypothetical protein
MNNNSDKKITNVEPLDTFIANAIVTCEHRNKMLSDQLDRKKNEYAESIAKMNDEIKEMEEGVILVKNVVVNNKRDEIIDYIVSNGLQKLTQISNILSDEFDSSIFNSNIATMKITADEFSAKKGEKLLFLLHSGVEARFPNSSDFFVERFDEDQKINIKFTRNDPVVTIKDKVYAVNPDEFKSSDKCSVLIEQFQKKSLLSKPDEKGIVTCGKTSVAKGQGYVLIVPIEANDDKN